VAASTGLVALLLVALAHRLLGPGTLASRLRFATLFSLATVAYASVVLAYVLIRVRPGWLAGIGLVAVFYLGVELLAAPNMAGRLRLEQYVMARNPDHRPLGGRPGWNSDGLRQALEPDAYREEGVNVLFLGDSFTQGSKLEDPLRDAFPHVVGRELQSAFPEQTIRVANFGWTSSSPLLSLRRLRDIGEKYEPDLVVLCVDMTDPHDDIKWANLIERRGICALYQTLPITAKVLSSTAPGLFWWLYDRSVGGNLPYHRFFATEQPLSDSRPFLEPIAANIDLIADEARRLGAEFTVFVLPRWFQYDERECPEDWEMDEPRGHHTVLGPYSTVIFDWFAELGASRGYEVFSLLEDFQETDVFPTCLVDDPHWNPDGHRVAADGITARLLPQVRGLTGG
jgi:lysophospholipase L1-like esterase